MRGDLARLETEKMCYIRWVLGVKLLCFIKWVLHMCVLHRLGACVCVLQ